MTKQLEDSSAAADSGTSTFESHRSSNLNDFVFVPRRKSNCDFNWQASEDRKESTEGQFQTGGQRNSDAPRKESMDCSTVEIVKDARQKSAGHKTEMRSSNSRTSLSTKSKQESEELTKPKSKHSEKRKSKQSEKRTNEGNLHKELKDLESIAYNASNSQTSARACSQLLDDSLLAAASNSLSELFGFAGADHTRAPDAKDETTSPFPVLFDMKTPPKSPAEHADDEKSTSFPKPKRNEHSVPKDAKSGKRRSKKKSHEGCINQESRSNLKAVIEEQPSASEGTTTVAIRRSASANPKQVHVSEPDSAQIRAFDKLEQIGFVRTSEGTMKDKSKADCASELCSEKMVEKIARKDAMKKDLEQIDPKKPEKENKGPFHDFLEMKDPGKALHTQDELCSPHKQEDQPRYLEKTDDPLNAVLKDAEALHEDDQTSCNLINMSAVAIQEAHFLDAEPQDRDAYPGPLTPVDGEVLIPTDMFFRLKCLGRIARRRGAHVYCEKGSPGVKVLLRSESGSSASIIKKTQTQCGILFGDEF